MYRIIKLFQTYGEPCAKIQKTESQFRSKQQDVKLAEIFLVPGKPRLTTSDYSQTDEEGSDVDENDVEKM